MEFKDYTNFYEWIDDSIIVVDFDNMYDVGLPIIEQFKIVLGYEDELGGRSKNTIYVWCKNNEYFKAELTLKNIIGFENGYTIIGFGNSVKECINDVITQVSDDSNELEEEN